MNDGFERLPPHSLDAEKALIGSLALAGEDRTVIAHARQLVSRDDLYQADHQIIFDTIVRLHDQHRSIDGLTVREEMKRSGLFEECGGKGYLGEVLFSVPSSANYAHYAGIVREKSLWRQLIAVSNDALRDAYAPRSGELVDESAGVIMSYAARLARIAAGAEAVKVHKIDDPIAEVIGRRSSGEESRISTGLERLDKVIGGLRKGGKMIIGGKPGMGKSSLLKQIAINLARSGVKTGIITIEESRHKIAENVLANVSGVANNRIAFGTASPQEWDSIEMAAQQVAGIPLFVVDSARKISQITALAQLLATQYGCEVIGVDHLHIIDGECRENRNIEVTKISGALKQCWKDLGVAGIEAAQLNRGGGSERPTPANLRESGSLEADGDVILLLHRDDYYRKTGGGGPMDHVLEVLVAKSKDGPCGTVYLDFAESRQLITSPPDRSENTNGNGNHFVSAHVSIPQEDPTEGMF